MRKASYYYPVPKATQQPVPGSLPQRRFLYLPVLPHGPEPTLQAAGRHPPHPHLVEMTKPKASLVTWAEPQVRSLLTGIWAFPARSGTRLSDLGQGAFLGGRRDCQGQ